MRSIALLVLVCVGASARSVKKTDFDAFSRTLKGVLKHRHKDVPRITDSASLEFEEVNSDQPYKISDSPIIQQDLGRVHQKIVKPVILKTEEKNVETNDETTTSSLVFDEAQTLSKSDLDSDDILDDDVDECIEGDVMRVVCNTCVCSDGKYFCSKRDCVDNKPLPPPHKTSPKRKGTIIYHSVKGEASGIIPNNVEKFSNSAEGLRQNVTANNSGTLDAVVTNNNAQCIDGRTRPVDCNQCICALGQWACTKMSCIALTFREKASYNGNKFLESVGTLKEHSNIDEDCMEGDAKPVGCNQCVCHMHSWACSDFTCPSTPAPPKPELIQEACQIEEDVKSKDCNICSCRHGVWVCTKNDCKKFGNRYFNPIFNKHHSMENDKEDS